MQEYRTESDESFYLYHIHKKKGNRRKKSDSVFKEPEHSSRPSTGVVLEASVDMTMNPETPTPSPEIDVYGCGASSPQLGQIPALESLSSAEDTFTHSNKPWVTTNSEISHMQIAAQFPFFPDSSFDGYAQDLEPAYRQYPQYAMDEPLCYGSPNIEFHPHYQHPQHAIGQPLNLSSPQSQCLQDVLVQLSNYGSADLLSPDLRYPQNVYAKKCGYELPTSYLVLSISMPNMSQLSYVTTGSPNLPSASLYQYLQHGFAQPFGSALPVLLSPPQRQSVMPMQEIAPSIYNRLSDSSNSDSQMGDYGEVSAEMSCWSRDHKALEVNFEECLQDSPTPPNPFTDEQLQMLGQQVEFLLPDGFSRDNPNAIFTAQKVTQDSAADSSGFNHLDFLTPSLANLPGESSSFEISSLIGGHMTGNCGLNQPNHRNTELHAVRFEAQLSNY